MPRVQIEKPTEATWVDDERVRDAALPSSEQRVHHGRNR